MKNTLFALILFFLALAVIVFLDLFGFQGKYDETVFTHPTTLQILKGEVTVNDSSAQDGRIIIQGDRISVGASTQASIVFFDDSISRLKPESAVLVKQLNDTDYLDGGGTIELELEKGEIWSKVQKQTGEDFHFGVGSRRVNATIRGSAINVAFDGQTTLIQAAEHTALVTERDENGALKEEISLVEGEQIRLEEEPTEIPSEELDEDELLENENQVGVQRTLAKAVQPISEADKKTSWFSRNETQDEQHLVQVEKKQQEQRAENVGALPGTIGYQVKRAKDSLDQILAGETEKEQLKLQVAQRTLAEAQILASKGKDASLQVQKATRLISQVAENGSPEIQQSVKRTIQQGKISVRNTLPNESRYTIKQTLRAIELNTANETEKVKIQSKQLERKILDVYDLQKQDPNAPEVQTLKAELKQEIFSTENTPNSSYLDATPEVTPSQVIRPEIHEAPEDIELPEDIIEEETVYEELPVKTNTEAVPTPKTVTPKEEPKTNLPTGIQINTNVKKSE